MLSDTSHSPLYRKIEETISRNDFRSAEHLIEKHREELAQDEVQTLRTLVEQKQKANVRANRHRQRQRRWDRCLRQHPILSVLVSKGHSYRTCHSASRLDLYQSTIHECILLPFTLWCRQSTTHAVRRHHNGIDIVDCVRVLWSSFYNT